MEVVILLLGITVGYTVNEHVECRLKPTEHRVENSCSHAPRETIRRRKRL